MFTKIDSENAFLIATKKKKKKEEEFLYFRFNPLNWGLKSFRHAKIQTHFTIAADF